MKGQCTAITHQGGRCQKLATGSDGLCWTHDPANADSRRRNASRAGRAKPNREVGALKDELATLAEGVRNGSVERADAAVINQILNTRTRLVELERKIAEQDEIMARIEALEQRAHNEGRLKRA